VEDSTDLFKPISIDTIYASKDKFNMDIPLHLSYALIKNEFVIDIVYGDILVDTIFDRRPRQKIIYKWPDNFDKMRKLEVSRTE
jgi:hypothetical protein